MRSSRGLIADTTLVDGVDGVDGGGVVAVDGCADVAEDERGGDPEEVDDPKVCRFDAVGMRFVSFDVF